MVEKDTYVDLEPQSGPVRLTKLLTERESKSTGTVGQAPSQIHVSKLSSHQGPVSYIGSGWYRPVTALGQGRTAAPATRKDFYAAVEAYSQKHPDVVAKYYPNPPDNGKEEYARKGSLRERPLETASIWGKRTASPQDRVATRSSTSKAAARRRSGRTRETITGQVHVTRLKDYSGAEFRAVGGGWYVQDSSRTGSWVVVPTGPWIPGN